MLTAKVPTPPTFGAMSDTFPHNPLRFEAGSLSSDAQLELYGKLLLPRMIEEKMMSQLRQGKISKWFSGMGQEAISVGVAAAMPEDKFIFPMHRNLGIFTTRKVPLDRLFAQFQGKDQPRLYQRPRQELSLRQPRTSHCRDDQPPRSATGPCRWGCAG